LYPQLQTRRRKNIYIWLKIRKPIWCFTSAAQTIAGLEHPKDHPKAENDEAADRQ
jgi:hypothetical protein